MDIAEQVQQLRLVDRLEKDAERDLRHTETMQSRRWELLRRVAGYAGDSYTAMRIDTLDEKLRDQGATHWLSSILVVAVTLIPVSAVTSVFIAGLTTTTQKLLTRADRKLMQSAEEFLETRFDSPRWGKTAGDWLRLQDAIKQTDDKLAKSTKEWLEPELTGLLQGYRDALAKEVGKQPYGQASGRKSIQSDVPVVQIKKSLDGWIDTQISAQDVACKKIRKQIRDLADIARAPDPKKEAKAKEAEAREAEHWKEIGRRQLRQMSRSAPQMSRRAAEEPLPNKNETALDQLKKLQEHVALMSAESTLTPSSENLWDLQLTIESMIWATTYDFTPILKDVNLNPPQGEAVVLAEWVTRTNEATLSSGLWKRLIERYIDPAAPKGMTYKEAGNSKNLAKMSASATPSPELKKAIQKQIEEGKKWSPEFRLSYYFGLNLYPEINTENEAMVRRFRSL